MLDALFKLGFTNFRPGQEVAVMRVLCGKYKYVYNLILLCTIWSLSTGPTGLFNLFLYSTGKSNLSHTEKYVGFR